MDAGMEPLKLREMERTRLLDYFESSSADYARESPKFRHLAFDVALLRSQAEFRELFGEPGTVKPGHFFYGIFDGANEIGHVHFSRSPQDDKAAFIWGFYLEAAMRGRGLGRRALLTAQEKLRSLGIGKIGLNVFSDNTPAVRLYESLGYRPTQMNLELKL